MKRLSFPIIAAGLAISLLAGTTAARAQEQRGSSSSRLGKHAGEKTSLVVLQKKAKEQKEQKKRKKARGRLPNYYARVGISKEQRERIYSIQAQYNEKIEALEKQLAELKSKRDAEVEAVLTPEQKKKLASLREEAAKKRKSRKKKSSKKPESSEQ